MKGVQLDLEFKGIIARGSIKPVKIYRAKYAAGRPRNVRSLP
jgi:hypothetical protein